MSGYKVIGDSASSALDFLKREYYGTPVWGIGLASAGALGVLALGAKFFFGRRKR